MSTTKVRGSLHVQKSQGFTRGYMQFNVSPSFTLELLERFAKVFKVSHAAVSCPIYCLRANLTMPRLGAVAWQDYCGVLTEEAIRKNFILIYELLDEMMVC